MEHYVCIGGCKNVSGKVGVCEASDCPRPGHPLIVCNCTDQKHHAAFEAIRKNAGRKEQKDDTQI